MTCATAWAQVNQSTALGQIELAEQERGTVDPANNVLEQHIANYQNSNGGPMLAKIGVQLGNIIRNPYAGLVMTVIMTLMVGAAWLRAMRDQAALGELGASLAIKFIIGIAVFHMPSLVYGVGMTVRDLGATIAKMAFTSPVAGPTLSTMSITGSPESLSFERVRATAIDRAIQDLGQPMNGVGANMAYLLYDQLVARAVSLAGQAGASTAADLELQTANKEGTAIEKSRIIDGNISRLLQMLDRSDESASFAYKTYRVGPDGVPDTQAGSDGGNFDNGKADGMNALSDNIDASTITITTATLYTWLGEADTIRKNFEQQAAQGSFPSQAAYAAAYRSALADYGDVVYIRTGGFIKKTFWENLGFSCGAVGGVNWSYLGNYGANDRQAIGVAQKNLSTWYENTTGRPAASFSPAPPADNKQKEFSKTIIDTLAYCRDQVITRGAMYVFDIIIEVYVFVIWLAYPLWFYSGTEKAFTGALNVFTVACLTPAVFTLLFVIWDAFIGFMIYWCNGGAITSL
ncbi:MAG TPA: hypothetical protein VNV15_06715 [Opitutaceae bacterium]|nr:hypothetical protein [Opitutaceae bacterium]